jgi:preprotein translocase subunit SecY
MSFFDQLKNFFQFKDLRMKAIYTIALLVLVRILAHIPLPGVNLTVLRQFFASNQIFGLLNLFSGGTMTNFSIILMGVAPYITATIVMQLLTMIIPSLEELSKEGESGQKKINQYSRYLTVPLAFIQSYAMIQLLIRGSNTQQPILAGGLGGVNLITACLTVTAGTILLMWIGELISENGLGNGVSLIITIGIIAGIPQMVRNTFALIFAGGITDWSKLVGLIAFLIIAVVTVIFIVIVSEGERKIPVTYARKAQGMTSYGGGVDTFLPMRVNQGGVIPIIFALSLVIFPSTIGKFLESAKSPWLAHFATKTVNLFTNNWFYGIIYFVLVILFNYFYTAIIFNPEKISENLQKQGGFIPGIRPGNETESYLKKVLNRINLSGGLFLGIIAVLPFIIQAATKITTLVLGGTGVLILVSVTLDTMRQIRSQMLMRSYQY